MKVHIKKIFQKIPVMQCDEEAAKKIKHECDGEWVN